MRKNKSAANLHAGKRKAKNPLKKTKKIGIKEKETPLKSSPSKCSVTFRIPKEAVPHAEKVAIIGEFNKWDINKNHMKKLKNGDFKVTIKLPCKSEYHFKYLINPHDWPDDECPADKCVCDSYTCED